MTEIVKFPIDSLADVSKHLRLLSDRIEAGEYGEIGCCAISMLGDELYVFSYGPESEVGAAALTLMAGVNFLTKPLLEHGK